MAQFNLNWFNTAVLINPNAISQRAVYRQKSVGGSFLSTGFTPANDLPKTATAATSPVLDENKIWEFKVQAICTVGGPTDNDNGIVENLKFLCLVPVLSQGTTTAQAVLNITGLDITKARFTLHLQSDDSVVFGPTIVNPIGNSITANATGLTGSTDYYWEIELYSMVNGVQVISSAVPPSGLGFSCISETVTTSPDICAPVTDIDALAVNT